LVVLVTDLLEKLIDVTRRYLGHIFLLGGAFLFYSLLGIALWGLPGGLFFGVALTGITYFSITYDP